MQESKKIKSRKIRNLDIKRSRKSIKSDNLHVPLTPSTFQKIKASSSRPSTAKSKSRGLKGKSFGEQEEPLVRLSHGPSSEVPENVAVHFASFYQNKDQKSLPHSIEEKDSGLAKTLRNSPKMEFTRQMVYKLEHLAGTQNYGRQVSTLLDDTVESPGFDLKLPPVDNCSPFKKSDHYYPLWYRDPNKMPQISRKQFRDLKDRYQCEVAAKKVGEEIQKSDQESISDFSSETEVELETETDPEEEESRFSNTKAHVSTKSSCSLKSSETNHCSNWSSQSSCSKMETEEEDEESISWETEAEDEEDKVEIMVARNLQKHIIKDNSYEIAAKF